MTIRFLLAGAAALALAACGSDAGDTGAADEAAMADDAAMADQGALAGDPAADAALPTDAQQFVSMQAASDMYEIEAGRLAEQNGSAQAVKDFGAMMVRDHTTSTENLRTAAGQAGGVTVNPQLTAKHQSDLEALRGAGDRFDSVYKQQQVAAHQQALDMLRNYASAGDNPALQDFARQTATVVEGHLRQARELP